MSANRREVFLERRAYRRRRMMDAARMIPLAGFILFLIPLLWMPGTTGSVGTGRVMLYLFAVWAVLIGISALLARVLTRPHDMQTVDPP